MKSILRAFILTFTLFISDVFGINENNFLLRHIRIENGLSDNRVVGCVQDRYGFMWIGTRDGLNQYDGYKFRVFRQEKNNPKSLCSSTISCLTCDKNGEVWIGTQSGLCKYDRTNEDFDTLDFTKGCSIEVFDFDTDNNLWVLINGEIVKYIPENGNKEIFKPKKGTKYTALCVDKNAVWAADASGFLYIINNTADTEIRYDLFSYSNQNGSRYIKKIIPSSAVNKLYIIYEKDDLKVFNIDDKTYKDLNLQAKSKQTFIISDLFENGNNELWIGSDFGLVKYDLNTDEITNAQKGDSQETATSTRFVTDIFKDRDGSIWISSKRNGVDYYSPSRPFNLYSPWTCKNGMKGFVIRCICSDKNGNIWIATEDAGINRLDKKSGTFTNYQSDFGKKGLSHYNIRGLASAGDKLWIGHLVHGMDLMDINTGEIVKNYSLLKDSTSIDNSRVSYIKVSSKGDVYVATDDGIYNFDPKKDRFIFSDKFPDTSIRCIYEDRLGRIWVGLNNTAYFLDPQTNHGTTVVYDKNSELNNNFINDICEDDNGNMWFATNEGIFKYVVQTNESACYTIENGLPSDKIFRMLPDKSGNLWVSTPAGLSYIDTETDKIITFTESNGLHTRQFNKGAAFKGDDGTFYFGTVKGVTYFNPKDIDLNESTDNVKAIALWINGEKKIKYVFNVDPSDSSINNITLKHDQSTFDILFSTLSFISPNDVKFFYRMGKNKEWISNNGSNRVKFSHLPPGKYTFEVRTANNNNKEANPSSKLHITILPPVWQTREAYCLYFIAFVSLLSFGFVQWRKRLKRDIERQHEHFEEKKTNEIHQAKLNFFINIAHEIRTPLTLIKSPLERLLQSADITDKDHKSLLIMHKNVEQLLSLVNQLLKVKDQKIEAYKPFFTNVNILELIEDAISRFEESEDGKTIEFVNEFKDEKLQVSADKEMLTKILNNLLSNAHKYGDKIIRIKLSADEQCEYVNIDISNDGQHIDFKYKDKVFEPFYRKDDNSDKIVGSGLGLPLARSLAEIHNGTLELLDDKEMTSFRLRLPIKQASEQVSIQTETEPITDKGGRPKKVQYEYERNRSTILIVEDNKDLNKFIAEEINQIYNVMVAFNGKEAIEILEKESIQLIISDIMMPLMDGIELLKKVKSTNEWCCIPVILLTAKAQIESHIEGLELGADVYLDKPFSNTLLKTHVTNLLYNRNILRKFYFDSPIANMNTIAHNKADENLMERFNKIVTDNIGNPDLDIDIIAELMNMSKSNLFKRIKSASDMSPNEIIKLTRLKKAAELLIQGDMKIYEISDSLGFGSQSYFSLAFTKQFGTSPTKFAKENR